MHHCRSPHSIQHLTEKFAMKSGDVRFEYVTSVSTLSSTDSRHVLFVKTNMVHSRCDSMSPKAIAESPHGTAAEFEAA
jgi:hypothetical protein